MIIISSVLLTKGQTDVGYIMNQSKKVQDESIKEGTE